MVSPVWRVGLCCPPVSLTYVYSGGFSVATQQCYTTGIASAAPGRVGVVHGVAADAADLRPGADVERVPGVGVAHAVVADSGVVAATGRRGRARVGGERKRKPSSTRAASPTPNRAASGSDYVLTGRLRCPKCGKPMIGTRATGRNKTYRYYTCWNLARYDASKCDAKRLNADAVDAAILGALADFYRTRHDLITDAITVEQAHHRAAHADRRAELATVEAQITTTDQAIDRYLTAFENGKMKEDLVADHVDRLRARLKQLRARRDDLTADLDDGPTAPDPAALADHIGDVIAEGSHNQTKALIARVTITGPTTLKPVFRIPQPRNANEAATTLPAKTASKGVVRTMTTSVGRAGLEPAAKGL